MKKTHFLCVCFVLLVAIAGLLTRASSANSGSEDKTLVSTASTTLVISQVYSGGGANTGSPTYTKDYVEIKNISSTPQSLNGLSLYYGSSSGQFASSATNAFALANINLQPGQYYLVALAAAGTAGGTIPVTPDETTTNLSMAAGSGKVALVNGLTQNSCGATATPCTLPNAQIIDLVSWGASNNAEGGVTVNNGVALTNTQGSVRNGNGCTDTDNNNADFTVVTGPVPHNSASPVSTCGMATIPDSNVDFNHDGKTDYVVVRGTGSPLTGSLTDGASKAFTNYRDRRRAQLQNAKNATSVAQAYWYTLINGTGEGSVTPWGDADQDVLVPQDFDGDGKDDIAVWRPGDPGAFYIIYSSTNTGAVFFLGSTFDDPTVSGDYDHDGKADPAVYSCPDPSGPAGNCFFRYIGSNNNPGQTVTEVFWGVGVALEFAPAPGDYDGDGKYDFCIRRENPGVPGQAQYALMRSSDFGQEQIDWGLMTDLNEPGDYDGDHKADFMVARNDSGNLNHYLLTRTGNFSVMQWGIANDIPTPGDYDGDGKSDVSVYRLGAMPANSTFYSISLTQGFIDAIEWGTCLAPCDTPAANWNVQ